MDDNVLQNIEKEKLATVIEQLVRGVAAEAIAHTIQEEWGHAQALSRGALERELTSLRLSIRDCGLGNKQSEPSTIPDDGLQLSPLARFTRLAQFQATRIDRLHKKELAQGKPLPALGQAIRDYANILLGLQQMRFDRGVDKYNRIKVTSREQQAAEESRKALDNQHIYNAVAVLEDIFKKRSILPEKT